MTFYLTGRYRPVFYLMLLCFILFNPKDSFADSHYKKISLEINNNKVTAEIADTDLLRAQGLMFRSKLNTDSGMLFVFEQSAMPCFWMKNTPLNLSIAFITDKGVITNIEHMQAQSLASHCPTAPIRYALEMEQGWFEGKAQPGDQVRGLPAQ